MLVPDLEAQGPILEHGSWRGPLVLPVLWDEEKQVGCAEGGHMVERGSKRMSAGS